MSTTTVRDRCRSGPLIVLAAGALTSTVCALKAVNQILADPSRYRNREVRLSGAAVHSYSVANRGAYQINDATGELWVVFEAGVPRRSARVTVKGTAGLVLLESSHKAKN